MHSAALHCNFRAEPAHRKRQRNLRIKQPQGREHSISNDVYADQAYLLQRCCCLRSESFSWFMLILNCVQVAASPRFRVTCSLSRVWNSKITAIPFRRTTSDRYVDDTLKKSYLIILILYLVQEFDVEKGNGKFDINMGRVIKKNWHPSHFWLIFKRLHRSPFWRLMEKKSLSPLRLLATSPKSTALQEATMSRKVWNI